MNFNNIRACFRRLRDRISGNEYKRPLIEGVHVDFDRTPIVSWSRLESAAAEIQNELAETRLQATNILEKLVERSEADRRRLELIFDNLNEAIVLTTKDGTITAANRTMRQLFHLRTDNIVGHKLCELFPNTCEPGIFLRESEAYIEYLKSSDCPVDCIACERKCDYNEFREFYANYVRTKSTMLNRLMQIEFERPDGATLHLQASINILTIDPFNTDFGYIVAFRDITDSKVAAAEVSRLQAFTASLMHITPVPVFYKDADMRFTSVNKPFRDLLDLDETDIIGKAAEHVFDGESVSKLNKLDQDVLRTGKTHHVTVDLKTLRGLVKNAKVYGKAVRHGGEAAGIAGSIYAHSELNASVRSSVFLAFSKAIVFLDKDMVVTGCNDEFLRLSGLNKQDIIGRSSTYGPLKPFLLESMTGFVSDTIDIGEYHVGRMGIPVSTLTGQQDGMIYVYFVHFDN